MTDVGMMRRLVLNALDFLRQSESEFSESPKTSVISFYTAVELMIKARLFAEHWTLATSKLTTRRKFEEGDFNSVNFEDAIGRLRDVVSAPISEDARRSFDAVRKHRNKMVHFFHDADEARLSTIAAEQLRAWYYLNQLLITTWREVFLPYANEIEALERSLTSRREYLRAKFNDLAPHITKLTTAGTAIVNCRACEFAASVVDEEVTGLFQSSCLVCGARRRWVVIDCGCGQLSEFEGDSDRFTCPHCNTVEDVGSLVSRLNEEICKPDEASLALTPANCGECEGYHTVIERDGQYLCLQCLDLNKTVEQCEWCIEYSTADVSDSYLLGCGHCEGHAGWHSDD